MDRRIIWTHTSKKQLKKIISYWNKRNKSNAYSKKLRKHLKSILKLISINAQIGKITNYPDHKVRSKTFMKNFQIIYEIRSEKIIILNFWDSRQNSEQNDYFKS